MTCIFLVDFNQYQTSRQSGSKRRYNFEAHPTYYYTIQSTIGEVLKKMQIFKIVLSLIISSITTCIINCLIILYGLVPSHCLCNWVYQSLSHFFSLLGLYLFLSHSKVLCFGSSIQLCS